MDGFLSRRYKTLSNLTISVYNISKKKALTLNQTLFTQIQTFHTHTPTYVYYIK